METVYTYNVQSVQKRKKIYCSVTVIPYKQPHTTLARIYILSQRPHDIFFHNKT